MKKILIPAIFLALLTTCLCASPGINSITDNGPVGLYSKFEAAFGLNTVYTNPYDPAQIDVNVDFTAPSGKHFNVNGFIYQGFTRTGDFNSQVLNPSGTLVWKARFTPNETGLWNYQISAYDGVTETSAVMQFTVNASANKGFIRASSKDPKYFAFDSGDTYFPLGEGMGWAGNGRTYQYDAWLPPLAANGGNYIRVWNAPWSTEVEWAFSYPSTPALPGNYGGRQQEAWELDHIFDLADSLNVKILLNLICHGKFSSITNPNWDSNPYNLAANPTGGLINTPQEVWTNAQVQVYLKRLWRYYISRYAYSSALFSWELWNEMEWTDDYANQVAASAAWHQAAKDYFTSMDPYHHLVTTSYAHASGWPTSVWDAGMDFTQEHNYGGTDMASYIHGTAAQMMASNPGKPFMQEELGISTTDSGASLDPTGLSIHESNWASLMSNCGGGAMPWWWDTWIYPSNLYYRWQGIAGFVQGEDLDSHGYTAVMPQVTTSVMADYTVSPGFTTWSAPAPGNNFTVNSNGTLTPAETSLGDRLYGSGYASSQNPPTFHVNYSAAGKFRITDVEEYSGSNNKNNSLRIDLDGATVFTQNPTSMGSVYEISVPAGIHTIYVTNSGSDWIVVNYAFTNYTGMLRCYALQGSHRVLGWVQSRNYNYWQQHLGTPLTQVNDGLVHLSGLSDNGNWRVTWWDTVLGSQSSSFDYTAYGKNLNFLVPGTSTDTAFKAYYLGPGTPVNTPTVSATPTMGPSPSASPSATQTATPPADNSIYPFEDSTVMGWTYISGGLTSPQNSTLNSYLGSHSLSVSVNFASSKNGGIETAFLPVSDVLGRTITAHVWVPADFPASGGSQIYIKSGGWVWQNGAWKNLTPGIWNTVNFDCSHPSFTGSGTPAQSGIQRLGVQISVPNTYAGSWSGTCYIDSIDMTTPVPTTTATAVVTAAPTPPVPSAAPGLSGVYVYPSLLNCKNAGGCVITFANLTKQCVIRLYNVHGEIVYTSEVDAPSGSYQLDISTKNRTISPGIYVYCVSNGKKDRITGKFAVVK